MIAEAQWNVPSSFRRITRRKCTLGLQGMPDSVSNQPENDEKLILDYGKAKPLVSQIIEKIPRPSKLTILLIVIVGISQCWVWSDHEPWVIEQSFWAHHRRLPDVCRRIEGELWSKIHPLAKAAIKRGLRLQYMKSPAANSSAILLQQRAIRTRSAFHPIGRAFWIRMPSCGMETRDARSQT